MSLLGWRLCKLYEVGKMTPGQASLCKVWGLGVTSQFLAVTWILYSWFVQLAWLYLSFRSKDYCLNFSFSGLWVWCINQQHTEGVTCVKLFWFWRLGTLYEQERQWHWDGSFWVAMEFCQTFLLQRSVPCISTLGQSHKGSLLVQVGLYYCLWDENAITMVWSLHFRNDTL
jgi:hypothetical protein